MPDRKQRYSWRAMMSILIGIAFLVLVISGVILFLSPPGRVANWSGWRMLGYSKHDWSDLHIWFAALFIVAAVLHIVFNIRPLVSYFRSRFTRRLGLRWEWVSALGIAAAVFAGTRASVPPFSTFLAFNERIKQSWEDPARGAPIPHAELLTLEQLAEKAQLPLETTVQRLNQHGLQDVAAEIVVAELASRNNLSAEQLYQIMQGRSTHGSGRGRSGAGGGAGADGHGRPSGGWGGGGGGGGGAGRMTLDEFCESRGIDLKEAKTRLQSQGIQGTEGSTLRELAMSHGYDRPFDLIEIIEGRGP